MPDLSQNGIKERLGQKRLIALSAIKKRKLKQTKIPRISDFPVGDAREI